MSALPFSVVMPTFDRRATLEQVLAAWERQEPRELGFEIIVVDDGSSDGSADLLAAWRSERYPLRFWRQANAGPAAARNGALAAARGELVLFTGDDIEPAPDLLAEHLRAHAAHPGPGRAIVGLTRWPPGAALTGTMRHIDGPGAQQFSYHYFQDGETYDFRHFYTSNVSVRRELIEREEGFSEDFPAAAFEDAEYAHRLAFHGLEIVYHAAAVGYHHHPYGARAFYRRQQRCGTMAALLYRRHPELKKWVGLRELEWARLARLAELPARRAMPAIDENALRRERAIALAERFDDTDPPGFDPYLRILFACAFEDGLAHAFFPPEEAAAILLERWRPLAGPTRVLADELKSLGVWMPAADLELLSGSP